MTSRERMAAAMAGTRSDRVPVMCQMSIGHMLLQLGVSPTDFWNDGDVFADGLCRMRDQYQFDGVLVSLHGHDPSWRDRIAERIAEGESERIVWRDGSSTLYVRDDLPEHTPERKISPREPGDRLPDTTSYIPVSQGLHFGIHPDHRFDVFRSVRKIAGRDISLHGEVTSAFDYFIDWLGYEQALMLLIDDPPRARQILLHFASAVAALAREMCREDIDAVKISSPFAGAGFLSRDQYQDFVQPVESVVAAAIRHAGKHAYVHTCGAIGDRLDLIQATGADGLECLDPPPMGTVELNEALRELGGKVFVKGNIDSVASLLEGTPESIQADAEARLAAGKAYGRFILSTACSIAPHVPSSHVRLLHSLVEEHGAYGS